MRSTFTAVRPGGRERRACASIAAAAAAGHNDDDDDDEDDPPVLALALSTGTDDGVAETVDFEIEETRFCAIGNKGIIDLILRFW